MENKLNYYEYDDSHYDVTELVPVERTEVISEEYKLSLVLSSDFVEYLRCKKCGSVYLHGDTGSSEHFFINTETHELVLMKVFKDIIVYDCHCDTGILCIEHASMGEAIHYTEKR